MWGTLGSTGRLLLKSIQTPPLPSVQKFTSDFPFLKSGFHTLVSDVRIVSVAECFVKRWGRSYGNTLAIVSNDPYVTSESIVQIEPCSQPRPKGLLGIFQNGELWSNLPF